MTQMMRVRIVAALLLLTTSALAGSGDNSKAAGVPKPVIEGARGEQCVEETDFMRRNHMNLLKHQRDKTVHTGIRTKKHSLKNCIDCHASVKTNSVVGSNENFCQSCHSYAAVKIDCFECHASKSKATIASAPRRPPRGNPPAGLSNATTTSEPR